MFCSLWIYFCSKKAFLKVVALKNCCPLLPLVEKTKTIESSFVSTNCLGKAEIKVNANNNVVIIVVTWGVVNKIKIK
ncbi:hypothetical protein SCLARK_00631 [Spiroplasma clarkii]|nr:hypothetical protein SCLARK_00631 [Spiroplasma clarkii]